MAVSHIMLEAYKKYILVSLILHGKVQPLPKYTSQIVGRFIKVRTDRHLHHLLFSIVLAYLVFYSFIFYFFNFLIFFYYLQPLSNAYHELAQVYTTNNPSELRSLVNKHSETFTRDNNTGLVKQCLSSLYKKNIQRLTKVRGYGHNICELVCLKTNQRVFNLMAACLLFPADLPDAFFARHGKSSAAVRPPGSREICVAHGKSKSQ